MRYMLRNPQTKLAFLSRFPFIFFRDVDIASQNRSQAPVHSSNSNFYVTKPWPTSDNVSFTDEAGFQFYLCVTNRTRNNFHRSSFRCARLHRTTRLPAGRERSSDQLRFKYRERVVARLCVAEGEAVVSACLAITSISYSLLSLGGPT